jgi:hypothetical protein
MKKTARIFSVASIVGIFNFTIFAATLGNAFGGLSDAIHAMARFPLFTFWLPSGRLEWFIALNALIWVTIAGFAYWFVSFRVKRLK